MSNLFRFSVLVLSIVFVAKTGWGADAGVVFMKTIGKHIYHESVPADAVHNYYTTLEGPTWENKYCSWRTYLDQDNRNCIDITGKKKVQPTLAHYDEPNADVHAEHDWGTDILKVGSTLGIGAFRVLYGDETWRNPQLGIDIDSLVVDLIDTTYDSPKLQLAYWGWKITTSAKINVFWTIETKKEMRSTMCELKIDGPANNAKIVVGMTKTAGVKLIQDEQKHNLITIGVQTEKQDSLMIALHADTKYFNSFTSNSAHYAILLNLDANNTAKWAFTHSWIQESEPLFRKANWQQDLFNDLPTITNIRQPFYHLNNDVSLNEQQANGYLIFDLEGRLLSRSTSLPRNGVNHLASKGLYACRSSINNGKAYMLPMLHSVK